MDKAEPIETPYNVELTAETDEVTVLRKVQRVVGKYDLLRFIFKTPTGYKSKNTFLEVENKQGGELAKFGLPALFLPMRIQPPRWMKAMLGVRIVLGILAIVALMASNPLERTLTLGADWIRAYALLLLVLVSGKWEDFVLALVKEAKGARLK